MAIREVWKSNLDAELLLFRRYIQSFPVISLDTEYPGVLRKTPRYAAPEHLYADMKYNVDHLEIIQLGITLSRGIEEPVVTFQFSFSDFDYEKHAHDPESLRLLRTSGIDLDKTRSEGISAKEFQSEIIRIFAGNWKNFCWVTFHGIYDMGFALKLLSGYDKPLPTTLFDFNQVCVRAFSNVYDLKYMARHVEGLMGGELGLKKLADNLGIKREGMAHQAGSDSLVTARAFSNMMSKFHLPDDLCRGFLYGLNFRIEQRQQPKWVWYNGYPVPMGGARAPYSAAPWCYYGVGWTAERISRVVGNGNQFPFVFNHRIIKALSD